VTRLALGDEQVERVKSRQIGELLRCTGSSGSRLVTEVPGPLVERGVVSRLGVAATRGRTGTIA
jgi:hypothetical protein